MFGAYGVCVCVPHLPDVEETLCTASEDLSKREVEFDRTCKGLVTSGKLKMLSRVRTARALGFKAYDPDPGFSV